MGFLPAARVSVCRSVKRRETLERGWEPALVFSGCQHRSLSPAKTLTCKLGKGEMLVCWPFEVVMRVAQKFCPRWRFPASPALAPHQSLVSGRR